MRKPLIISVDGSDASLQALDWAVPEAARHGVPLRIVHVAPQELHARVIPAFGTERPSHRIMAEHITGSAQERAERLGPGVQISAGILSGEPATALVEAGRGAFAAVLGARGRRGVTGPLLGSTSLAVAGRATCPIVVVRGAEPNVEGRFGRICLGVGRVDGPPASVRFAFREAEARGADLYVLHSWRHEASELVRNPLEARGTPGRDSAREATAVEEALGRVSPLHPAVTVRVGTAGAQARDLLLDASRTSDLLVLGARRQDAAVGRRLGPTGHALLRLAMCPVAVIPYVP